MPKFFVEPVLGYRAWHVNCGTYALNSPVCKKEWADDGPTKATCDPVMVYYKPARLIDVPRPSSHLQGEHESPDKECYCGLYGWHRPEETRSYYDNTEHAIIGACLAWGKYRVATKGFRIQYMQPLAFSDPFPDREVLGWKSLRAQAVEKYDVPLLEFNELQEYAEQFASPMGLEFTTDSH